MSADLLAEFDSFYQAPQQNQQPSASATNDLSFLSNSNHTAASSHIGGNTQWQQPSQNPADNIWGAFGSFQETQTVQQNVAHTVAPEEDIWGSFEASVPQIPAQINPSVQSNFGGFTAANSAGNRPSGVRRSTLDMFSSNIHDDTAPIPGPQVRPPPQPKPKPSRKSSSGGDILFDATDEISGEAEDDDEFGDFETVTEPVQPPAPPPSQSLSGLFGATTLKQKPSKRPADLLPSSNSLSAGGLPYPQAPKSPSFQQRNPYADLGLATKQISTIKKDEKPKSASPVTAWPTFEPSVPKLDPYEDSPAPNNAADDEWGDFADLPPENSISASVKPVSGIEADAWAWDVADRVTEHAPPMNVPPPTNIPPPSVLLALFPPLFDLPQSTLFKAVANQPFSLKNRIISDSSTIDFLRAYLLIATVAARIIAGRKLRWKRDTLLSQAMKIGPAAAGGKGGMKLTGVDKAETTREDREATDVIRVWKEQLGRLRSAVAVANTSMKDVSKHLDIPELSETMSVKTQDGGLTAPKPCIICGLKREERVNKVDTRVEDSFGEWWTEHWGHRACRNFWQEHESKLKHR